MTTVATTRQSKPSAFKAVVPTLVRDIGAPTLAYYLLHRNGASDFSALLAGALVSGALLVFEAVKARKLEVFSGFMLGIFAFGLVASLISGDARMMVVKDSFGTALAGLAFAVSALTVKPLIYFAARKATPDPVAFEAKYTTTPLMRTRMRVMSAVWGVGFLIEAATRIVLAYQLPVHTMVWLSTVLMFGAIGVLSAITALWMKRIDAAKISEK